ncbi:adenylate kinase [Candidatus Acetothermia bacterium]|nr:adenylate kinase [Candidatus Acetothermia bacterium]MCI2427591.1 adenylate kinase [Candidatus Acetothermia bacterium]
MRELTTIALTILGPPGAGKGTQAKMIAKDTGLVHLSTGDILRDELARGSKLGQEAKEYMDKGELLPDDLMIKMIEERINEQDGFILDGFPRTLAQAEALEKIVALDFAINITLSREEVILRLTARRACTECGRIYNLQFDPPAGNDESCDNCGIKLVQRDDDRPAVIEKRFDIYMAATRPLIEFYRQRGILVEVNGAATQREIFAQIMSIIAV